MKGVSSPAYCCRCHDAVAPDTPTVAETYPGVEVVTWYSISAPAKTPRDIVLKLNAEITRFGKLIRETGTRIE